MTKDFEREAHERPSGLAAATPGPVGNPGPASRSEGVAVLSEPGRSWPGDTDSVATPRQSGSAEETRATEHPGSESTALAYFRFLAFYDGLGT